MSKEQETIELLESVERLQHGHEFEALLYKGELDWQRRIKQMHEDKAAAYRFVANKIRRQFNIPKTTAKPH